MKVLVACEYSGTVRNAFLQLGHDAMSCDLLPTDVPGPHYQGDVRDILYDGWDLLIAHPPCQYLCSSGLHWNKRRPERAALTEQALDFVRLLLDAPIKHIALENSVGCISTRIRPPDQTIQPWMFGEDASKATCLWLKNLPPLRETERYPPPYGRRQTAMVQPDRQRPEQTGSERGQVEDPQQDVPRHRAGHGFAVVLVLFVALSVATITAAFIYLLR